MRLSDVSVGESVVVRHIVPGPASTRFEDLGLIAGTVVLVERRAPMGDPTIYEFRGTRMALRKSDASSVEVTSSTAALSTHAAAK
jgi:Fe2+ transport system protein FeoA